MKKSIYVLKDAEDDDVVTLERTWVLLCIALMLVPGTGNMVSLDYLASLKDMDELNEFVWDEHILATALREVKKYQLKREAGASGFWIGGCLPMFPIIYMDFLEVPRSLISEQTLNYSLPRACFVCDADFKLVVEFDRNKLTLDKVDFGKRNVRSGLISCILNYFSFRAFLGDKLLPILLLFLLCMHHRSLSERPYAILEADNQGEGQNQHHRADATKKANKPSAQIRDESDIGAEVFGSLDEWLHPLPSSQELEIPLHLQPIYEKHKKLHMAEMKNVVGQVLQSIFGKRLGHMLVEMHSIAASNQEQRCEGGDMTFVVPRVNATSNQEHTGAATFGIPRATATGMADTSFTGQRSEHETQEEVGADDRNKTQPGGVAAGLKEGESSPLGGKVGAEAEQEEGGAAGQTISNAEICGGSVLQQGKSSDHSRGMDGVEVEQEEVVLQGARGITQDVCNMDPFGAADNVATPSLSQGTLKAMAIAALEWDGGPLCELFSEGTEDQEWFKKIPDSPVKLAQTPNASSSDVQHSISSGLTFDNTP